MVVPVLPDLPRITSYTISVADDGPFSVDFDIYADGDDAENFIEVWLDGVEQTGNWTLTSDTGADLSILTRPITDAKITFTSAITGSLTIVGARRPRRTSIFENGIGVPADRLNYTYNDIMAILREFYDLRDRMYLAPAGSLGGVVPPADAGLITPPASSTDNAIVRWNGATGDAVQNSGVIIDDSDAFTSKLKIKNGYPWADVRAWGALGDATTDDSAAFASAIAALAPYGGGIVLCGPGSYYVPSGIAIGGASTQNITIQGAGRTATYIFSNDVDVTVVSIGTSGQSYINDCSIFGKGSSPFPDTGTFGATQNAVQWDGAGGGMRDAQIFGGYYPLALGSTAIDNKFFNVETREGFGPANVYINGASWFYRCKWDQSATTIGNATGLPIPARADTTSYSQGDSVASDSYVLTCQTAGTSGSGAPTLKNYKQSITDGSVTWQLAAPEVFSGLFIDTSAGENHFHQVDLTGVYSASLTNNGGAGTITVFSSGVLAQPVSLLSGALFMLQGNELGDDITVDTAYAGITCISGNCGVTSAIDVDINIGANVSNFIISNNYLGGGTITVASGSSDYYQITNNTKATVADLGSGANKTLIYEGGAVISGPLNLAIASAGQIRFPSSQNASADANTLDDYAEGTWTPVLTFATAGDLSVVYNSQVGNYTKIGRQVTCWFIVSTTTFTHTTASGNCRITGLPFTVGAALNFRGGSLAWQGITKANYTQIAANVIAGQTYMEFNVSGSGQALDSLDPADMPSAGNVIFAGTVTYDT